MAKLGRGRACRRPAGSWCALAALLLATLTAACAEPGNVPLCLPQPCDCKLDDLLSQVAPDVPFEDQPPGLTIAQQAHRTIACFEDPLDTVLQYRIPIDFDPQYLPEIFPGLNNAQLGGEQLLFNWQLNQSLHVNPFRVAAKQARELECDPDTREEKLAYLAAYAFVHRDDGELGEGLADSLLTEYSYSRNDVLVSALGPLVLKRLPKQLTQVSPGEDEVAVELCVTPGFAYNSVATNEQMLVNAAAHGMGAVAIASRTSLGDAQDAQRIAERLKCEGRLPADFRVIVGQYITSRTGDVVGLFLKDRVLDGQTMVETVKEIHELGGLAYMARPGEVGAAAELERLPFDGYFIQPGNFQLFRTLLLLNDPRFADKPALYASCTTIGFGAGFPYSNVKLDRGACDPLKAGLQQRQGYAASPLYFPWMMFLVSKPIATYQKTLNQYFQLTDKLTLMVGRTIGADNMIIRTTWDEEMSDLISIVHAPSSLHQLLAGGSDLRELPHLTYAEAEFGWLAVGYDQDRHEVELVGRWRW